MKTKVLDGKCVAITRPRGQENVLADLLSTLGAAVLACPLIRIVPNLQADHLAQIITGIPGFDWVCFTSANGVNLVLELAKERNLVDRFRETKIACIGPATRSALESWGLKAEFIPDSFRAEGLLDSFSKIDIQGKKFLLLRARGSREILAEGLLMNGAVPVVDVPVYAAVDDEEGIDELAAAIRGNGVDCVTLTSPSTVRSFKRVVEMMGRAAFRKKEIALASIGPVTSSALRRIRLAPDIEAETFTAEGLAHAIQAYYGR